LQRVTGEEMSPSLQPGDWVLLGPGRPDPGEVFALEDPSEPGRQVFRRVVALSGQTASYAGGQLAVDGQRIRLREMGRQDDTQFLSEANRWLIRRRAVVDRTERSEERVPEGSAWLLADARDVATDSRWWGPVEVSSLGRQVLLRYGASTEWRGSFSARAMDGPWNVPPPQ
jgi:signal peptidase I